MSAKPEQGRGKHRFLKFGCLPALAIIVLIVIMVSVSGGGDGKSTAADKPGTSATGKAPGPQKKNSTATPADKTKKTAAPKVVTFKVWGTAPAGALGPIDITYGSDSDNRDGHFANGTFTATLPLTKDAEYYDVSAQLQGSGDIQCSVTADGHTKTGHAAGGYNICDAQLSSGLFGDWN